MSNLVFRVAGPAMVLGILLSGSCLIAAWQINRLQRNLALVLPNHVLAVEAAQRMEILHRDLRFFLLAQRLSPTSELTRQIEKAHKDFQINLETARKVASENEQVVLARIDRAFRGYLAEAKGHKTPFQSLDEIRRWTEVHPVSGVDSCHDFLELNNEEMREAVQASDIMSRRVQAALLLCCLIGPLAGFIGGFGTARRMHQSIARMLVLVRDVHAQLDEEVGLLEIDASPSLATLDEKLAHFVDQVGEVTRQMQRQQQDILRGEQLAAVGQLAAAVAHEIRNPLTGIKLLIETGRRSVGTSGLTREDLDFIYREVGRLERTVQGLLDYSRPPAVHAVKDDIRQAVLLAYERCRHRARLQGVIVRLVFPEEPMIATHDRDQIAAILSNLIINALDAMPEGGAVSITMDRVSQLRTPKVGMKAEEIIRVRVCDNGPGLSEELLARLFTPFSSTKPTGTGLGLSLSRRLARQHRGDLTADNSPGGGACFTLSIPELGPESSDGKCINRG